MNEEKGDQEARTEDPSERKLAEARDSGNLPYSTEASLAASLLACAIALHLSGPALITAVGMTGRRLLGHVDGPSLNGSADVWHLFAAACRPAVSAVAVVLLLPAALALMASFAQNRPAFKFNRFRPDLSRVSPVAGLSRLFGRQTRFDLLRALFRLAGGLALFWVWFLRSAGQLAGAGDFAADALPRLLLELVSDLVHRLTIFIAMLAILDLARVRLKWWRDLRMSRDELKREHKEAEGDPLVKSRLRMLARSRIRSRMMASVPQASVVIVNPTHLSIALRFVRDLDEAPLVLAKGRDLIALRIREIAVLHDIPVIENRPLARAMFDKVEVDSRIPVQFYKAVAVIIHQISRRGAIGFGPKI